VAFRPCEHATCDLDDHVASAEDLLDVISPNSSAREMRAKPRDQAFARSRFLSPGSAIDLFEVVTTAHVPFDNHGAENNHRGRAAVLSIAGLHLVRSDEAFLLQLPEKIDSHTYQIRVARRDRRASHGGLPRRLRSVRHREERPRELRISEHVLDKLVDHPIDAPLERGVGPSRTAEHWKAGLVLLHQQDTAVSGELHPKAVRRF
jgi:hypothetical protein